MAALVVRAIDQKTVDASGAHLSKCDLLLAGELGHALLKRGPIGVGNWANGDQVSRITALALKRGKSVDFTGYWQRHVA
jgi:hypothetical protein